MYCLNFGPQRIGGLYSDVRGALGHGGIGTCLLASGYDSGQLVRNELPDGDEDYFDPQLYLAGLDPSGADKRVKRLATHAWFLPDGVDEFDSSEIGKRDWLKDIEDRLSDVWPGCAPSKPSDIDRSIRYAIEKQLEVGVTRVILPSPLLEAREDGAAVCGTWARRGMAVAKELKVDFECVATIAIRDDILNESAFKSLGFIDQVVTEVASCRDLAGVYVVVGQTGSPCHPFLAQQRVWRGYRELVERISTVPHLRTRIVNFADMAGIGCVAVGATHAFGGSTHSTRRLALETSGDGRAYPLYFTSLMMAEIRPEDDLTPIAKAGMLSLIEDPSPFCSGLFAALKAGGTATSVSDWVQEKNNVQYSQRHIVWKSAELTNGLLKMGLKRARSEFRNAIDTADGNQAKIWPLLTAQATRYKIVLDDLKSSLGY